MGVTRKVLNWYAKFSPARGHVKPPYEHVVQIGDPSLRKVCEPVPFDKIKTAEVQNVLRKLQYVLVKYGSVGMSAPQIGVNLRIFAMQHTLSQMKLDSKESNSVKGVTVIPFTVFINPTMKVVDYQKLVFEEGCESVRGFVADVPRYREVEISGYSTGAEATTKVYSDWAARIVQHEMDHLNGKLYTDIMDRKTFSCTCWEEVNLSQGKVAIPFSPE